MMLHKFAQHSYFELIPKLARAWNFTVRCNDACFHKARCSTTILLGAAPKIVLQPCTLFRQSKECTGYSSTPATHPVL